MSPRKQTRFDANSLPDKLRPVDQQVGPSDSDVSAWHTFERRSASSLSSGSLSANRRLLCAKACCCHCDDRSKRGPNHCRDYPQRSCFILRREPRNVEGAQKPDEVKLRQSRILIRGVSSNLLATEAAGMDGRGLFGGGKGLHIVVPVERAMDWAGVRPSPRRRADRRGSTGPLHYLRRHLRNDPVA